VQDVRGHRQGSTRKDGRFTTVRTVEGRRRSFYQNKGESRKSVKERADAWAYEARQGVGRPEVALSRAIALYMEHRKGDGLSWSTYKDDQFMARLLTREIGGVRIGKLDPIGVELALRRLAERPRTAKKFRDYGRKLYKWLAKRAWVSRNPFAEAQPVRYVPGGYEEPMGAADFERALARVAVEAMKPLYLFLRWTGVRPTSARSLTWFEVTDDGQKMYVRKASAKTPAGRRRIRVHEPARSAVLSMPKTSEYVFPSTSSRRPTWSAKYVLDVWKRAQVDAGLEPRSVYDLKHLRITELCELFDGDADAVALVVGLQSSEVVRRHYRQYDQERLDSRSEGRSKVGQDGLD